MMTLGQKIKQFRKHAGLSQLALELEIEASPGHLSRIENGQINPTKEIIVDIAKALNLNTKEIASLFGIEFLDNNHLFEETTRILSTHNFNEVLNLTVNNLIFKLGYLASAILLVNGNHVRFAALTMSNLAKKTIGCLDKPIDALSLSLSRDTSNLTIKAIKENKVYLTHYTREYIVPAVTRQTADKIQELTGDKSNIIYPLSVDSKPFGAIVYVKKYEDDFRNERETLGVVSKQIAVAIQNARKFEALSSPLSRGD